MTRLASEDGNQPEAQAMGWRLVETLTKGSAEEISAISSMPFWAGEWTENGEIAGKNLFRLMAEGRAKKTYIKENLNPFTVRIYPLSDLAVLYPRSWKQLQAAGREPLKGLSLAAVGYWNPDELETEHLLFLVRKVAGQWTLAGLPEVNLNELEMDKGE